MKIVAGLGSIDEYETFVKAGADELFCGYVPFSWAEKYGVFQPLNRREVLFYNVQIGSMSELMILKKMMDYYGKPVKLTFNSLSYTNEQYPLIAEIISQCMAAGFTDFIIADMALILYLRQQNIPCKIHVSGELSEVNRGMIEQLLPFGIKRIIFHRKNSLEDMRSCISYLTEKKQERVLAWKDCCTDEIPDVPAEFEAFVLNELCHFSGAFCNSLHCDELTHLCRVPYELGNVREQPPVNRKNSKENILCAQNLLQVQEKNDEPSEEAFDADGYLTGSTGCGLCALYQLKQAGITHLKLVGRGNYTDFMEKDIRQLKKALQILDNVDNEQEFLFEMKKTLFPKGCSNRCYYFQTTE